MRNRVLMRLAGAGAMALGVSSVALSGATSPAAGAATRSLPPVKHVFVIVLENQGYGSTFGKPSADPYLARTLPSQGAVGGQHDPSPSPAGLPRVFHIRVRGPGVPEAVLTAGAGSGTQAHPGIRPGAARAWLPGLLPCLECGNGRAYLNVLNARPHPTGSGGRATLGRHLRPGMPL